MKDLDGKELEVGAIYHILGSGSRPVIGRFSHETPNSLIFQGIRNINSQIRSGNNILLYSWKRQIIKWDIREYYQVIKVSQEILDRYAII